MDRIRRLPLPALLPIVFIAVGGVYFLAGFLTEPSHRDVATRAIGALFYAVLMTLFFGVLISIRRRKAGGADAVAAMHRTLRTGAVPADAEPTVWNPELERYRTRFRRNRWTMPILTAVFVLMSVYLATTSPFWWLVLVVFLALGSYSLWETRRALRNIDVALTELRHRPAMNAPAGSTEGTPQPTPGASWSISGSDGPTPDAE